MDLGGEGVPYGPFLEALRALGRELQPDDLAELLGEVGPELVAVAPGFARFLTPPATGGRRPAAPVRVPSPAAGARATRRACSS